MLTVSRRSLFQAAIGIVGPALLVEQVSATPEEGSGVAVRMITHLNGLGDNGYNDLATTGGLRTVSELEVEFVVIESVTPADFEANVLDSADSVAQDVEHLANE